MSPDLTRAIRALLDVVHVMKLDAVLVGALVSELAAIEDEGLTPPRGTNDADFALRMRSWEEFAKFKDALVAAGFKPAPKIEHRLFLQSAMIDVLPYGPDIAKNGEILWPISELPMGVLGFEEACARAVESQVDPLLRVRRLTIPGFILLKMMAFLDRRAAGNEKYKSDAEDLLYWFENYASGKHEEKRYEIIGKGLSEISFDSAGAALLGMDVRSLVSPAASLRVQSFLASAVDLYGPFAGSVVSPSFDERRERVVSLASAFKRGFDAGASPVG